jgi:uncharacterized protein
MMMLPLFPLHAVAFPGVKMPLRVFEPRYRSLLSDALRAQARFGVALIQRGKEVGDDEVVPHRVGCVVEILGLDHHGDSIHVEVEGVETFDVTRIVRAKPYLVAEVRIRKEPTPSVGQVDEARAIQQRLVEILKALPADARGGLPEPARIAKVDPLAAVRWATHAMPVDLHFKQAILENVSPEAAWRALHGVLDATARELKVSAASFKNESAQG